MTEELDPFESFERRAAEVRELQTRRAESRRRRRAWYRNTLSDALSTALGTVLAAVILLLGGSFLGLIGDQSPWERISLALALVTLIATIVAGIRFISREVLSEASMLADIEREEAVRYFREERRKRGQRDEERDRHTRSSTASDASGTTTGPDRPE